MVVTTSQDGYFKTWTLVDDSNIYSMYFLSFLPYSTQIIGNVVVSLLMLYLNTVKLLLEIINIDISMCLKMVVSLWKQILCFAPDNISVINFFSVTFDPKTLGKYKN